MSNDRKNRVFLSYASEDLDTVRQVYEGLKKRNHDVWFDKEHSKKGRWKNQIRKAISRSRYFVICISQAALRKTGDDTSGFQDEELDYAYSIAEAQPETEFTILPVRLEDCNRGDFRLSAWQQYDLFDNMEKGLDKLAVDMAGISLSDLTAKDERTEDEKLIDGLFNKVRAKFFAGKYKESISLLDAILALSANDNRAWQEKGIVLASSDRYEEALEVFEKLLQIYPNGDPNGAITWHNKGHTLSGLGRHKEALEAFDKALQVYPNNAHSLYSKGDVLHKLGRNEEAIEAFNKALELDPDDTSALKYRDVLMKQLKGNDGSLPSR